MQYPTTYPQNYPQLYPQNYTQPNYYQQQQAQNLQQQQTPQIQNSGFLPAPNENYVNTFPIGAGNCITFKIEGKPIVMEKSMGFSQFESPKIKRYRLVEEAEAEEKPVSEYETLLSRLDNLESEMDGLKKKLSNNYRKKENTDDTKSHNADDK